MLLLDEPFGALDALTRGVIRRAARNLRGDAADVFMITHDVDEALLLADRILLMSNGPRAVIAETVRKHHVGARARPSAGSRRGCDTLLAAEYSFERFNRDNRQVVRHR